VRFGQDAGIGGEVAERTEEVSAGGLVVRRGASGYEALIAEQLDRNSGRRTTRLPKGKIDPGETREEAALREVREEVGLHARIVAPLGDVSYAFYERRAARQIAKRVHYYLMAHAGGEAHAADGEMAAVWWCPLAEAELRMSFDAEREIVARGRALLESPDAPTL
jgi:8-oxo-dGTP pyrophosphatase MutT (NUDIX family)